MQPAQKKILLVGGAGYIGSHVAVCLLKSCYSVVILDDLSNSHASVIASIEEISEKKVDFVRGDMRDRSLLASVFQNHDIAAVILLAGLKSVPESVEEPAAYYDVNVGGAVSVLAAMQEAKCGTLIFSSSATVYGRPQYLPIDENHPVGPLNPYGHSKLMIEQIVADQDMAGHLKKSVSLRYFNPVGAHPSGLIGENPRGIPGNLFPRVAEIFAEGSKAVPIYGDDFETPDGTGMRDFIHVEDLALGHVKALSFLEAALERQHMCVNLGTGTAYSVLEVLDCWQKVTGQNAPRDVLDRRRGDVAACWADPSRAQSLFGWSAHKALPEMCESHWHAFCKR